MRILPNILLLFLVMLCAPSHAFALSSVFDTYKENGIIVSQESNMAPMAFVGDDGEPKGFIIDLWKKWSAETGIPVTFRLVEWGKTLTDVREGRADVHGGLFFTEARDEFLDYSTPFFPSTGGVFVRRGIGIRDVSQIERRRVGVVQHSFFDAWLHQEYPNAIPVYFKTTRELADSAIRGEISAFVGDYPTVMFQVGAMGKLDEFENIGSSGTQQFRAAVAEGNFSLLGVVERGLELVDEHERHTIFSRWVIGQPEQRPSWLVPSIAIVLAGLVGIALRPIVLGWKKRQRS